MGAKPGRRWSARLLVRGQGQRQFTAAPVSLDWRRRAPPCMPEGERKALARVSAHLSFFLGPHPLRLATADHQHQTNPQFDLARHTGAAGDLSQLLQLSAATKKAANLRLRRRKSSQSRDSDSDEGGGAPDEAAGATPVSADKMAPPRRSMSHAMSRAQISLNAEL